MCLKFFIIKNEKKIKSTSHINSDLGACFVFIYIHMKEWQSENPISQIMLDSGVPMLLLFCQTMETPGSGFSKSDY